jgi:hypothetical protein
MPIEPYPHADSQPDDNSVIWRFMRFERFADLVTTGELYFCRSDLFTDENEGLPPEDYVRRVCRDMGPGHDFNNTVGILRQESGGLLCIVLVSVRPRNSKDVGNVRK